MILKPLIILSLIYNLAGLSLSSTAIDQKIATYYSKENISSVSPANLHQTVPEIFKTPSIRSAAPKPGVNTREYALVDLESGEVLHQKEAYKRVPIASTTKIMSAVVVLENFTLDEVVTVPLE